MAHFWLVANSRPHSEHCWFFSFDEVPGVQGQKRQGHNLQGGEARRQAHVERPLTGEIPVMARTNDPPAEVEDGVEVDQACGGLVLTTPIWWNMMAHQDRGERARRILPHKDG